MSVLEALARMGLQLPPFLHHGQAEQAHAADAAADGAASAASSNGSAPFPAGAMDSFLETAGQASPLLQLLLFAYRQLDSQLGLDPSVVLTMAGLGWGLCKMASQAQRHVAGFVERHLTCAMSVSQYDHIYVQLMKWLSQKQSIRSSRFLMAQTVWRSAWEEEEEEEEEGEGEDGQGDGDGGDGGRLERALSWTDGGDGDGEPKYLNFSNQAARSSPRYIPAMGVTSFWHRGTYFRVCRSKESVVNTGGWSPIKDVEQIKISCFGRSMEPIKRLLAEAKTVYYHDTYRKTAIYRPRPKEMRHDSGMWQQVARRPVRPMRTVVLDSREKHGVMDDINDYLHPATPRWYASRGIPLRRGYLFHGPPGTGKTSFSFALAGVFGIDIYVISLQDANVSEEDLAALFSRLPRRCIVLLEDIDTAGLRRDAHPGGAHGQAAAAESRQPLANGVDGSKESKESKVDGAKGARKGSDGSDGSDGSGDSSSDGERGRAPPKRGKTTGRRRRGKAGGGAAGGQDNMSLSGLLNAIDGVASHEGRVLIMTTIKPEALDEALIRPGRVDVQVAFANASSAQAAELFCRMYEAERRSRPRDSTRQTTRQRAGERQPQCDAGGPSAERVEAIADDFGRRIPGGVFSPAEIQGFLLKRKKSPRRALEDVDAWVEAARKQKEANSKVLTVQ